MASVDSPVRTFVKPILFKLLGQKPYFWLQVYGKWRDIRHRLVEEAEMELLPFLIKADDETLDVGANYAYYTDRMSQLVGTGGTVYAFEPIPFTCRVAKALLRVRKRENVELFEKGVSDKNEQVTFRVPLQDFGAPSAGLSHFASRNNEQSGREIVYRFDKDDMVSCQVVRIDDFLLHRLKHLSFVKIDIEGAEYFAFKGMLRTAARFRPVVLVELQPFFLSGFGIAHDEVLRLIDEMGYRIFLYDATRKRLTPFAPPLTDRNYILLHRERLHEYGRLIA